MFDGTNTIMLRMLVDGEIVDYNVYIIHKLTHPPTGMILFRLDNGAELIFKDQEALDHFKEIL